MRGVRCHLQGISSTLVFRLTFVSFSVFWNEGDELLHGPVWRVSRPGRDRFPGVGPGAGPAAGAAEVHVHTGQRNVGPVLAP
jgi:hypothetical protein